MPELMGNDPALDSSGSGHLIQRFTEPADEGVFAKGAGEQAAVGRQRIEGAKEAEPLHQRANGRIHRDHAFGLELSEGDQNGPLSG